jgi:outer membrane protein OmpA-like peptidoglycan-associated protein
MSTDSTPRIVVNGVTAGDTATVTGALPGKLAATCSFVAAAAVNSCDMSKMTGGTWSLTATATDVAGNVSASSAPTRLIVSAALAPAAPTTPVLQPVTASLVSNATTLNFGTSAALAGIQTVTFVVTNEAGKVVRTTTIMPKPNDTKASIEIPKDLKGAKVQVYTTNQCGVSANAPKNVNVSRGKTASQKAPYGVPTPKGDMVLPAIDFAASEITLDDADKAALDKVAKAVGDRCGTLLVTGYSRFNDKDSKKYLQNLADFRAKAVSDYLSRIGVDMWIVYRGYVVKAGENDAQRFRRAEIRWVPA